MTGEVKSFDRSHRYGFITVSDMDYRFTRKDWGLRLPPTKGMMVEFTPTNTEKGMRAEDIRIAR